MSFPKSLAKGYIEDLNVDSVTCNGVHPVSWKLANDQWIFKFNRQDFTGVLNMDKVPLVVEGNFGAEFNYGNLAFEGSDIIKVRKRK
ncbi:MAG: hypothetical protein JXA41_06230 [Deltaproteobacteria bacterium]|nr:hypothetical protein [Deltaproteobacteria bacterium]